ncbi:MAG: hypothetical protein R3E83_15355 [Burkholderiaceae bacterium]
MSAIILFIMAILVMVAMPRLLDTLLVGEHSESLVVLSSQATIVLTVLAAVLFLYRWGASRRSAAWRWLWPGALLTVMIGTLGSWLFTYGI